MYKVVSGKTHGLKDVDKFIELLTKITSYPMAEARSIFENKTDLVVSRAPGRLDVMGGIADYSGSLVLQMPIEEATFAAIQLNTEQKLKIVSLSGDDFDRSNYFEMPLDDFKNNEQHFDYKSVRQYFLKNRATRWAAYVAGAFFVLIKEKGINFRRGANILIHSNVPEGKGVSSSAALEVATMSAVVGAFGVTISPFDLALLCQKVENLVVGAPCGIMDQMTSVFGKANRLLALLCQPAELKTFVNIPADVAFWGIDSGIRHSVSGSEYTSVRIGAFMGQRIISQMMEQNIAGIFNGIQNKFLANFTPSEFEQYFAAQLPTHLSGDEFIKRYQNTYDPVTTIDPKIVYSIFKPTAHAIYEHFRVRTFAELLQKPLTESTLTQLGELMYQSHASYSACGVGSEGTDRIVELSREFGAKSDLFGAKITGGGCGGTVCLMGKASALPSIKTLIEKYAAETGYQPTVLSGSSMGAQKFGHLILKQS